MRFENLAHVHTRGNTERIENDFHRRAVGQIRHVLLGHDPRDDALVAVATRHLVADGQFALHRDVNFYELDDARRQFVALLQLFLALLRDLSEDVNLPRCHFLDFVNLLDEERVFVGKAQAFQIARGYLFQNLTRQIRALREQALVGALVVQVGHERLAAQQSSEALQALISENADFVRKVLLKLEDLRCFNGLMTFVLLRALAAEDLDVHDRALDARRAIERGVAHVAGLFAEDGAQQLLFRRKSGFTFRSYFADEDVAWLHGRANSNHTAFVQIAEETFVDVGYVAGDFFGAKFGVARLDFVFLNVNRGVVVLLHQLFAHENRVFEVVAAPRQERDEHVAAERKLATFGAWPVSKNLPLLDAVARAHQRLLVDASVLIGALELGEQIDVGTDFSAQHARLVGFDTHDDSLGVHLIDYAVALAADNRTRIARGYSLHSCSNERSLPANQWHGLALHVRAHQGAVRVVILKERDEAGRNGDELLGRYVDVVHFLTRFEDEVPCLAAVDEFGRDFAALVERSIGLRDDVAVFFPRRLIEAVCLRRDLAAAQLRVRRVHLVFFHDFARLEFAAAGIDNLDVVDHAAILHLAVRRLDKSEFVDARVT